MTISRFFGIVILVMYQVHIAECALCIADHFLGKGGITDIKQVTIQLSTINDAKKFVAIVTGYDFDIDLISGRYVVDAKSIMGIFSMDISKPITLVAQTDNADELMADIAEYIV